MSHKLLLADDSVTIQRVIELTFADEEITVVAVGDGEQAIARIESERPDIVLADVGMPTHDGYEVAEHVRRTPALAHIPVILLTGAFEPVDEARAHAAGCAAVLAKPFEPQMVIAKVRELLAGARPPFSVVTPTDEPASAVSPADALLAAPSTHTSDPPTVDEYFARLDAAFAHMNSAPERQDQEASAAVATAWSAADRSSFVDAAVAEKTPARVAEKPAPVVVQKREPEADTETAMPAGPAVAAPAAGSASLAEAPGLADAFAALLAVEQGEEPPAAFAPQAGVVITDQLIDAIARRVVERLGDQAVRSLAADVISRTAERVVREEIDRLKAKLPVE
jgi:CheY-like chemotaxis protein